MKRRFVAAVTAAFMVLAFPAFAFGAEVGTAQTVKNAAVKKKAATSEAIYVKGTDHYSYSGEVLKFVNQERKKAGKKALVMDAQLQKDAMQRAAETALFFSHERPDGTMCFSISEKMHGENIAMGYLNAKSVVAGWMDSPGHRANILFDDYASIGVGCFSQGGSLYWVQAFSAYPAETKAASGKNKTVTHNIQAAVGSITPSFSSKKTMNVGKGQSASMTVEVKTPMSYAPIKAEAKSFLWSSSKSSVASVNTKGTITGKKTGSASIKAKLPGSGKTISRKVKVVASPKKAVIKSVKRGYGSLKITWKRDRKASGYQAVIAKDKKFKKGKKSAAITKNTTTTKTFKKLTRKKTYYIKVRSYKKVGGQKVYGAYSKVKKVKVK